MSASRKHSWKVEEDGKTFIVKVSCETKSYQISVSDLVFLWTGTFSEEELQSLFSKLNPLIEGEDGSSLVPKIFSLLLDHFEGKGGEIHFTHGEDDNLIFQFKTAMEGIPLKFQVKLSKQPPLTFYSEIINPFLQGASELLSRQEELYSLLEAKDREIAEYKLEGAEITRINIKTKPFIRQEFSSKCHVNIMFQNLQKFLDVMEVSLEQPVAAIKSSPPKLDEPEPTPLVEGVVLDKTTQGFEPSAVVSYKVEEKDRPIKKKRPKLRL